MPTTQQTVLVKAVPVWILIMGILIIGIGVFLYFKKGAGIVFPSVVAIIGLIISAYWIGDRKDMMCNPNNYNDCSPVK